MQLTDNVYLVGGGPFTGFGLTSGPDSHVYLLDGGEDGLVLVDSGSGLDDSFEEIVANISGHGFDPSRIGVIALTHYHADHAGGAPRFQEQFGATIAVHQDAADALENADEKAAGLEAARRAGVFPDEVRMRECSVGLRLSDGDGIAVGDGNLQMVSTPGHCGGHGSYLLTGLGPAAVFAGDALFWAGRILLQSVPDCDLGESVHSVERLASLEFESFFPGHGAITVSGGGVHAAMAKTEIDSLSVPKSIL
jgi:glyoxylase-like metal-dependent hydrolase (beta-lactamase superfamily II)